MKLAVNAVLFAINQAVAESLVLAERAGIARSVAYDVFASSAAAAPVVHYRRAVFEHPETAAVTFPIDLAIKDLDLVIALGSDVGAAAAAGRDQPRRDARRVGRRARSGGHGSDGHLSPRDPVGSDIADVTLKDIAESIGVNASTVSRALDPAKAHLVNAATLARVREAAKHLGYRGDHVAGSLRRRATATIGVIVADLANPFIAPVIHGIAKALAAEQMLPLIFETQDDAERLTWGVDHLLSRRVDAIIVAGARFGDRAGPRGGDAVHPGGRRRARPARQPAAARPARRPGGRGDGGATPDRPRPHPPRRAPRPDGHRQLRRPSRGLPRRLP